VARALEENAPPGSAVARWGGEEFVVVVHGDSALQAVEAGELLRRSVSEVGFFGMNGPSHVTASIGVAVWSGSTSAAVSSNDLIAMADDALYCSKHAGRDQVSVACYSESPTCEAVSG
jgi:diguanylate cyclase (GGDEF)-like protein